MKAKLDENLPLQIASRLRKLGHDVHTTQEENLSGCDDSELWAQASRKVALSSRKTWISPTAAASRLVPITVSCWFGCTLPAGCD
jgi:Domain of unknown function (DUF5615)